MVIALEPGRQPAAVDEDVVMRVALPALASRRVCRQQLCPD